MIGLPYGEKLWRYVKPLSSDISEHHGQTNGQKDGQNCYQYRASASLTRDKNQFVINIWILTLQRCSNLRVWYHISFARYSDLFVENREFFYTPPVFSAPAGDDPVGISWRYLMLVKLERLGYSMVKTYDDMLSRFHLIYRNITDRRTDRQTDRIAINIARQRHWRAIKTS